MSGETETRRCVRCWEILPLDAEHFGRSPSKGAGFTHHCRKCSKSNAPRIAPEWLPTEDGMVWT